MNLTNIKKSFTDLTNWTRQGFADLEENIKDMAEDKLSMMTGWFVANQTELDMTKNALPNQGGGSFTNPKDRIYNLKDNEVWEYANEMWSLVPGATIDDLGGRVMLHNPITKKMFYMHDAGSIVRIDTSDI